jgi:acyl-CoA thioesterase-2
MAGLACLALFASARLVERESCFRPLAQAGTVWANQGPMRGTVPAISIDDLLTCLQLEEGAEGLYRGSNLPLDYRRVFGGQILAQLVAAARAASPDKTVKSMTVLFPREGSPAEALDYRVIRHQDGRTFGTTAIVVSQGAKVVASASVSMHTDEEGLLREDALPASAGAPGSGEPVDLGMVPWEICIVGGVDLSSRESGPPDLQMWSRAPSGVLTDDLSTHQALLAHATDLTVIGTALRPFEGLSQSDSTVKFHSAVTSHTMWFHQPFRVDDWLLIDQHSPVVARGRAFGRGDVFTAEGSLVASFAQESMVRML